MHDMEKVIKGLKCCAAMSGDECSKCPYGDECRDTDLPYGMPHLASDALALLKPVEPEIKMENLSIRQDPELTVYCGACKGEMVHKYSDYPVNIMKENYQYCHHCGRKVLWK